MQYIARMRFELPTRSFPSLSSIASLPSMPALPGDLNARLTEASHTIIGFAAMAAKQANDRRLGVNSRFEPQVRELRKNAVGTVKSVSSARGRVADTVDPIVDRMVERFPDGIQESVSETVTEFRKVGRQTATTVEQRMIEAIEFATAIPAKPVRRTAAAAASTKAPNQTATKAAKTAKPAAKPAAKTAAKATSKSAPKSAPKSSARTAQAASATTAKRVAKKSPAKRAA